MHRRKGICNTESTGEDHAKYWRTDAFKRRIISAIAAIMLYACTIWSEALSVETIRRILSSVYRLSVFRQTNGFRTVSDEAVLILAKAIPMDIYACINQLKEELLNCRII